MKTATRRKRKPADAAFTQSDNHALGDLKLQPWTASRVVAAQSMGMLYPNIGAQAAAQFRRTGVYQGALKDTIIVLWLCSEKDRDVIRSAERDPDGALEQAETWAEKRGITKLNSPAFWAAYTKFMAIVTEEQESIAVPENSAVEDEDDHDPNE